MKLGKHVSIAGGIDKSVARAREIGCNCLQIFAGNPRGWKNRKISPHEIKLLKDKLKENNMLSPVIHSNYLINIASPKEELWQKSVASLREEYRKAGLLGADYLVVHPGNHTGSGVEEGCKRAVQALQKVLAGASNEVFLLLENVAGSGTGIGAEIRELAAIINNCPENEYLGICFDTCHAFAAGYNVAEKEGINLLLDEINNTVGLDRLKVVHINDSRYPLGSNKDEHAHIGEGQIDPAGFGYIVNHKLMRDLPFILETPQFSGSRDKDVEKLLSFREN